MLTIKKEIQSEIIFTTMEELVPKESLFRKIDKYIDFTFIYEEVKDLYSKNNGRPSVDPVVLFKLVFIQTLDGIKSMRKLCEKIKVDAEYRWFLGIPFGEGTPHFSTFSKNYERRFKGTYTFENIFSNILIQAQSYGMLDDEFFMDSTHKKANANKNKHRNEIIKEVKKRKKALEEEINEERKRTNKKPFKYKDETVEKSIKVSITDPESGYYHRDEKEKGFMYLDHRTVNGKCNIITDCYITKGNVHDSVPCIERLEYQKKKYNFEINKVALDSGYDTLDIKKYFKEKKIFGVVQYRSYGQGKTKIRKYKFIYLKEQDAYICPKTGIVLSYRNIDKLGYKAYYDRKQCSGCPYLKECCPTSKFRTIRRHINEDINEDARERRISIIGKELFKKRKTTIERSFGDAKQNHGYRYAMYRGVEKNQDYTWLICASQNIKNIALKRDKLERIIKNKTISLLFLEKLKILLKIIKRILKKIKIEPLNLKTRGLSTV